MFQRRYPSDFDCVWLASDRDGHIGAFITAGIGPIPLKVLNSEDVHIEDIESRLHHLPCVSDVDALMPGLEIGGFLRQILHGIKELMRKRHGLPTSVSDLAKRGLFVYDWSDVHKVRGQQVHAYFCIAKPTNPILFETLSEQCMGLLVGTKFESLTFADGNMIDVRKHIDCGESACS